MQAFQEHIAKDGFRLRGTAMSRVDGFSDVVFGFALTLLVVSLEVPHTYDELHAVLLGTLPFAICFLLFLTIWMAHFKFFRRYGLHDMGTIWINCVLLFTVLVYVYPMKFLFTLALGHTGPDVFSNRYQLRELMVLYGAGFAVIQLCFSALYWNASRQRHTLRLNAVEVSITRSTLWNYMGNAFCGLLCCLIAPLLPLHLAGYASFSFLLIIPWGRIHAVFARKFVRAARRKLTAEDRAALPHTS